MVVSKSSNSPPVSSRSTAEASRTTKVSQLHSWKKKKKKLRWVHVTSEEVNTALSGLLENTVVVLPESCVQAGGIQPNINDKNKPKKLWLLEGCAIFGTSSLRQCLKR
uniref:Uncharacterized protein n=1 Tax=Tetraselmis sp. GSL018 TaxID=582737 RepID=A0A061SFV3_9CHLO